MIRDEGLRSVSSWGYRWGTITQTRIRTPVDARRWIKAVSNLHIRRSKPFIEKFGSSKTSPQTLLNINICTATPQLSTRTSLQCEQQQQNCNFSIASLQFPSSLPLSSAPRYKSIISFEICVVDEWKMCNVNWYKNSKLNAAPWLPLTVQLAKPAQHKEHRAVLIG